MDKLYVEDTALKDTLEKYLHKLNTNTLTCAEKLNLVDFYVHDPNTLVKNVDTVSDSQLNQYTALGWYISSIISGE